MGSHSCDGNAVAQVCGGVAVDIGCLPFTVKEEEVLEGPCPGPSQESDSEITIGRNDEEAAALLSFHAPWSSLMGCSAPHKSVWKVTIISLPGMEKQVVRNLLCQMMNLQARSYVRSCRVVASQHFRMMPVLAIAIFVNGISGRQRL